MSKHRPEAADLELLLLEYCVERAREMAEALWTNDRQIARLMRFSRYWRSSRGC